MTISSPPINHAAAGHLTKKTYNSQQRFQLEHGGNHAEGAEENGEDPRCNDDGRTARVVIPCDVGQRAARGVQPCAHAHNNKPDRLGGGGGGGIHSMLHASSKYSLKDT